MINKSLFSSLKQDWETEEKFFNQLDSLFYFQVDLAANDENTKCKKWFTENENSLVQPWHLTESNQWLNPPYGKELRFWLEKAYLESKRGANICVLVPARTDTSYWHEFVFSKATILFIKGRLKFKNAISSAPFPSALIFYNIDVLPYKKELSSLGNLIIKGL